jgi:Toastrack DUF4097
MSARPGPTALVSAALLFLLPASPRAQQWKVLDGDDWCRDAGRADTCEVREITLPPGRDLVAVDSGGNGGIDVKGWDHKEIRVQALVRAWDTDESDAADVLSRITIRTDGVIEPDGPRNRHEAHWAVSFRLMVPEKSNVELDTSNGGISVTGVTGDLRLHTNNGGLSLEDVGGDVRGRTTNGGIHVALKGKSWQGDGLDLRTTNGGINVEMPAGYSADLEARTVNGGVSSDVGSRRELRGDRDGKRIRATLGDGGATLHLETTNGGIRLREAREKAPGRRRPHLARRAVPLHVRVHDRFRELRVELDAPRARSDAERVMRLELGTREQRRVRRERGHRLRVAGVRGKRRGQHAQQRVAASLRRRRDVHGADLAPARVPVHRAAERVGQELVAEADPEHRHALHHDVAQPLGGVFHPGRAIRHHVGRSRHDHAAARGRHAGDAAPRVDDRAARGCVAHRGADPVLEVTVTSLQRVERVARLQDHDHALVHLPAPSRPALTRAAAPF